MLVGDTTWLWIDFEWKFQITPGWYTYIRNKNVHVLQAVVVCVLNIAVNSCTNWDNIAVKVDFGIESHEADRLSII